VEDTGLRDRLAVERTVLANERTMLSWVRTGLGLGLAGTTFLKLFGDDPLYQGLSVVMIAVGCATGGFGLVVYAIRRRRYQI